MPSCVWGATSAPSVDGIRRSERAAAETAERHVRLEPVRLTTWKSGSTEPAEGLELSGVGGGCDGWGTRALAPHAALVRATLHLAAQRNNRPLHPG